MFFSLRVLPTNGRSWILLGHAKAAGKAWDDDVAVETLECSECSKSFGLCQVRVQHSPCGKNGMPANTMALIASDCG